MAWSGDMLASFRMIRALGCIRSVMMDLLRVVPIPLIVRMSVRIKDQLFWTSGETRCPSRPSWTTWLED